MTWEVNMGKATVLAVLVVTVGVLGAVGVLDAEYVKLTFTAALGYTIGNGVGAKNGNPSAALIKKKTD